tara:strand:- start:394 stop:1257 length:864 start_codon:yes stop_codon:yes gene_type:complete
MNIIIVALGIVPKYLDDCIKQISLTQKNYTIHLIKSRSSDYTNNNCLVVDAENIPISEKHSHFIKNSKLIKKKFRNYFWRFSTERLYVIDDYLQMQNLKDIIHIETDVLLYQDLELVMPVLRNYNFACVRDSNIRVIGSIIFIKNKEISKKISSIANDYIDENDMVILHHIEKKLNNTLCLPVGIQDIYIKNLRYIFDGASIGQFVGGIDSRNKTRKIMSLINRIKKKFMEDAEVSFVNKNSNVNISEWEIKWINNKPYKKINDHLIPIINLHIHSKNLKRFMCPTF